MTKKALITGGAGFIGFHLSKYLLKKGYKVHLIDNYMRGKKDKDFLSLIKEKNVKFYKIDLLKKKQLARLDRTYNLIFHFAAIVGVKNVIKKPYQVLEENVLILNNIIKFASTQKKLRRFCFTSSSEVYAVSARNNLVKPPVGEKVILAIKDLGDPRDTYLLSKIFGEAMCRHSGLPFLILRPHNIYGPRMGMSHVIPELLKKTHFIKNNKLNLFSPNHTRTFCFIDDAIKIIFKLVTNEKTLNQTYNVGNQSGEIKIKNLAKLILKTLNKDNKIKFLRDTVGSPKRRKPDMKKTNSLVSIKKKTSLKEGVLFTYNWYKDFFKLNFS